MGTFLLALNDFSVQNYFENLDISCDRTRLFDVIDADGSGTLELEELLQGLLQVRGDAQRSDILAAVLGVRAIMSHLKEHIEEISEFRKKVEEAWNRVPCNREPENDLDKLTHSSHSSESLQINKEESLISADWDVQPTDADLWPKPRVRNIVIDKMQGPVKGARDECHSRTSSREPLTRGGFREILW